MSEIRLAVIGVGLIGRTHLDLIHQNQQSSLVAVCDANPDALATAEAYGVPFYQTVSGLLAEQSLDGVIIATPTDLHAEIGIACAERGLHLLVEKPVAATLSDAAELAAAAERHNIQILVGHHRRHNPLVAAARQIVQSGAIGRLVAVSAHWLLQKPAAYFAAAWRRRRPAGGPALINLIHDVDNLRYICGEVTQVFAQTSSATRSYQVEDTLSVNLTFANGALGTILATDVAPAPWSYELTTGENPAYPPVDENCYHFCGTAGALAFPQMAMWRYPNEAASGWMQLLEKSLVPYESADPLVEQLAHFCQIIRGKTTPLVDARDATNSLSVILSILQSAETGEPCRPLIDNA